MFNRSDFEFENFDTNTIMTRHDLLIPVERGRGMLHGEGKGDGVWGKEWDWRVGIKEIDEEERSWRD